MKKLTVWAMFAILLVASSAFAAPVKVVANATFSSGSPASTNNDDSCDISVQPAATLLLPYFEVDLSDPLGETTLFTVTNVSQFEQIAHVVLWTDYSYPVIDFNIYLTGYDVQAINLYDVIQRGIVAPGASVNGTGVKHTNSPTGKYSDANGALTTTACSNLPGALPSIYVTRMQSAFTTGKVAALNATFGACSTVGGVHTNAVGYATIDVADACTTGLPTDGPTYFTTEARYDNVFIGDYQQVNSNENFAQGNTMVHIRAVPEGGDPTAASGIATNLPRTFYDRYVADDDIDRRQPLPSVFAARWINGGSTSFETSFKIWREGLTDGGLLSCSSWPLNDTAVTEFVVFDETENATGIVPTDIIVSPPIEGETITLPETSLTSVKDAGIFPQDSDLAGWMYMNLDNDETDGEASQNWVVSSMRADGRFSVDFDAAHLANGCTPAEAVSEVSETGGIFIGPGVSSDGVYDTGDPNYNP